MARWPETAIERGSIPEFLSAKASPMRARRGNSLRSGPVVARPDVAPFLRPQLAACRCGRRRHARGVSAAGRHWAMPRSPTCRPRPGSTRACSAGWSSGCSAARGTRRSPSRPPSRCSSARRSARSPAATRRGSARWRRARRCSWRRSRSSPGWSAPARSSTSSPRA